MPPSLHRGRTARSEVCLDALEENVTEIVARITQVPASTIELAGDLRVAYNVDSSQGLQLVAATDTAFDVRGLSREARRGVLLGMAGPAGAGAAEPAYPLAGHGRRPASGSVRLPGRSGAAGPFAEAGRLGIPLVPADRGREAIVADFAVSA